MSIDDVLEFIRTGGPDVWGQMTREMKTTSRLRNIGSAKKLRIGDRVRFDGIGESFEGHIRRVTSSGRAVLEVARSPEVPTGLISVPAAYVKLIA